MIQMISDNDSASSSRPASLTATTIHEEEKQGADVGELTREEVDGREGGIGHGKGTWEISGWKEG